MKQLAKLMSILVVALAFFLGCSQTTDSNDSLSEAEVTEKVLRNSIQESIDYLDADMSDYVAEYEKIQHGGLGDFIINKFYISADNKKMINTYSILMRAKTPEFDNNRLTEFNYDNKIVVQAVLDLSNTPLDLIDKTVGWVENNTTTDFDFVSAGFTAYTQSQTSFLRDTGGDWRDELGAWEIGASRNYTILLKKVETHLIVINLEASGSNYIFDNGDIQIYNANESFPYDFAPASAVIKEAKEQELAQAGFDVTGYTGPYTFEVLEGDTVVDYWAESYYISGNKIITVEVSVGNGMSYSLDQNGTVKIEEYFNETPSTSSRSFIRTEQTGPVSYNGSSFDLNGYTWYSWNNNAGTPVDYLMKESDNKLYRIKITVNNNEITDIEELEVYNKK